MSDLFDFRTSRPTQRRFNLADSLLLVPALPEEPPRFVLHAPPQVPPFGPFLVQLIDLVNNSPTAAELNDPARQLAGQFIAGSEFVDPDNLQRLASAVRAGDPAAPAIQQLLQLDYWLSERDNRPNAGDLETFLADLLPAGGAAPNAGEFRERFGLAWFRILDSLAAALLWRRGAQKAAALTRLWIVAGLVQSRYQSGAAFADADRIMRLLRDRVPMLPSPPFPRVLPPRSRQLARRVAIGDLWVVRKEWQCYVAGEIADIRNVMAGESMEQKFTRIDESEITTTTESSLQRSEEEEDSTSEKTDVSEETDREMKLSLHAEAQVGVSAQYSTMKVDVGAQVSADFALSDATRRASRFAREVTSRSLAKVEERIRSERVSRTLTRMEQSATHGFLNKDGGHISGIYRWVDRIDRLQLFRYPDRLLLEFQLPEPGRALRTLMKDPMGSMTARDPGDFLQSASAIGLNNYQDLAATYQAVGVPPPPTPVIAVTHSVAAGPPKELPDGNAKTIWNPSPVVSNDKMAVPPGYAASAASVSVAATPVRGMYERENERANSGAGPAEGFHQIVVSVAVGERLWTFRENGDDDTYPNTLQPGKQSNVYAQYGDAILLRSETDAPLSPIETGPSVPVTLSAVGANTLTATVELRCEPTSEAMAEWRQQVFDALLGAWQTQKREYNAELARLGLDRKALAERSSLRNAEMIRNELKRHIVSSLLVESPFQGRPAVIEAASSKGSDIHLPTAIEVADVVQFLEQAFEWGNLVYVPYPYYWADRTLWKELMGLEANDQDLARFLAAGSCRVVVPARPGFAAAVNHWLTFMQPWGGGTAPLPGEPDYLSVATEIRELDQPPQGGEAGESWDIRVPTTLQWLDPAGELPHNAVARLGKAPHAPADKLCPGQ